MIRLILAEDHSLVRDGIKTMLEKENDIEIVGEASNGLEVLALLKSGLNADIVLTDIGMPEIDGMQLSAELQKSYPYIHVIILSMLDSERYIFDAFNAGIKGYLLKNTNIAEMVFAIRTAYHGDRVICMELAMRMLEKAVAEHVSYSASENLHLSGREQEVLALISEGYTSQEIADKMFASRRTVEGHRLSLIEKTGVRNTAQLIKFACKAKLV